MNPLAAIRDMLKDVAGTYVEGVRVNAFGPDYQLKRDKTILDIENARAAAAQAKLESERGGEYHEVRMSAAEEARRENALKNATRSNVARGHGHSDDDAGVAEHEAEQELEGADLKKRSIESDIEWKRGRGERYEDTEEYRKEGLGLRERAADRADSNSVGMAAVRALANQVRERQLAGTWNPDLNAQDPRAPRATRAPRLPSPDRVEGVALERLSKRGILKPSEQQIMDEEAVVYKELEGQEAAFTPPPATTAAPKVAPSQSAGKTYIYQGKPLRWEQLPPQVQAILEKAGKR